MPQPTVFAVASKPTHHFSKITRPAITLVAGLGVSGDAHFGRTVQHRYNKRKTPDAPNLRQVHLLPCELFDEVAALGFTLDAGELGENITTQGLELLSLPLGTRLRIGREAVVELTGLRDPCTLINKFQPGLKEAMFARSDDGQTIRKSGVMSIVITGGEVKAGDSITIVKPDTPFTPLPVL